MSKVSEGVEKAKAFASETAESARTATSDAVATVKAKAEGAYDTTRTKAAEAVDATKRGAASATRKAGDAVQDNPLAVLVGGLALGALAGTLLPRTRREEELLGDVSRTIHDRAGEAVKAARAAGVEHLDSLGISKENAKAQASSLLDGVVKAAGSAGTAAAEKVKGA
ncbi:hypothetical protein [Sphingomonas sanxanigenens]|uniref:DUF883 domain-containing protein n=1 Tax=Sphingomonas sanxanigenens DSM 19645 = NX02 TaxID=1123269 RepID=W0AGI3_9SPHN|nr:hypothetical protein [Sphingomonas sanxanigenens]AHE54765.1 hypothetical protein NX02_15410 [Sphingomonas sanxanigenens DSM 19645 = NX02]